MTETPYKSALSKIRNRIHSSFFRNIFDDLISDYEPNRKGWRGLSVYGTDGDQFQLPDTEDVLNAGYRGYPCKDGMETHYPRMYVVHCCDLISGVTKEFKFANENQEVLLALEIATLLEP